jgi:hypothetical protein
MLGDSLSALIQLIQIQNLDTGVSSPEEVIHLLANSIG